MSRIATQQQTVLQLFEQMVVERPNATAIVFEERELSFRQLDQLVNQFAVALREAEVAAGDRVGLCIERCPEAVAVMLGVFRVGAAFVPLDPEYPLDRIQFMIEDADIRTVVTHDKASNQLACKLDQLASLQWIDSCSIEFAQIDADYPDHEDFRCASGDDLAYIMYTSGSTGKPKGVQIEHLALTTYCMADIEVYQLNADDRTLQFSTLNFDIAIEEIFPPLLIGSCVVIRPSERPDDAIELSSIVEKYGVTALHLATAYWHEWVDLMVAAGRRAPESLRLVIATGEKVSVEHYRRWLKLCSQEVLWCNAYGPTEATVSASVFIPDADFDEDNMPIGKALPGYTAHILNDELEPVADGETGQLFIGGPALARGYLNRDDLTSKAFLNVDLPSGTERLYRTGDLARWLPEENIEFAGRIDHQIKLGSYRIEPGEIEAAIHKHPDVLESLVTYEQVDGQKFLIAYVACGKKELSLSELSDFLRESLPPYMVPPRYCLLETFPKTINGKIDRQALPSPSESVTATHGSYVAPRNEMEKKLARLWESVLQIPQIGIHDDFFTLGGSSLLVTRVVAELTSEFKIELPVRDFFANPTIASSARHLRKLVQSEDDSVAESFGLSEELQERRSRLPELKADYICCGERQLFSVRYMPKRDDPRWTTPRNHGIVLCHALGHEYTRAYRNLQQLGIMLCTAGFDVLRFDYFGTGNSTGCCEDFRVESMQADLRHAVDYLQKSSDIEKVSVVGIRIGATIAATTQFDVPIQHRVLWDPIVDGAQFIRTLETLNNHVLTSQTRFAKRMQPKPNELYGHSWCDEKRSSFSRLRLPNASDYSDADLVLTSSGYLDDESGAKRIEDFANHRSTTDEICWHRPDFTESAFASPEAYREIVEFLKRGQLL